MDSRESPPPFFFHNNNKNNVNRYASIHHHDRNYMHHHHHDHQQHQQQQHHHQQQHQNRLHHRRDLFFQSPPRFRPPHPIEDLAIPRPPMHPHPFDIDPSLYSPPPRVSDRIGFDPDRLGRLPPPPNLTDFRSDGLPEIWGRGKGRGRVVEERRPYSIGWDREPDHPFDRIASSDPYLCYPLSENADLDLPRVTRFREDPEEFKFSFGRDNLEIDHFDEPRVHISEGFDGEQDRQVLWDHRDRHRSHQTHHHPFFVHSDPFLSSNSLALMSDHNSVGRTEDWHESSSFNAPKRQKFSLEASFVENPPSLIDSARGIEKEEAVLDVEGGDRVVPAKRVHPLLRLGKGKKVSGGNSAQELLWTPRKKFQRTSALVRVQSGKITRKRKDEQLHASAQQGLKGKGPSPLFSNYNPEKGKPVQLDVSFKSDALLIKEIGALSSPAINSVGTVTPKIKKKKKKKIVAPVSGLSSSPGPRKVCGRPVNVDAGLSSNKGIQNEKVLEKVAVSDIGTQPCPRGGVARTLKNNAVEGSVEGISGNSRTGNAPHKEGDGKNAPLDVGFAGEESAVSNLQSPSPSGCLDGQRDAISAWTKVNCVKDSAEDAIVEKEKGRGEETGVDVAEKDEMQVRERHEDSSMQEKQDIFPVEVHASDLDERPEKRDMEIEEELPQMQPGVEASLVFATNSNEEVTEPLIDELSKVDSPESLMVSEVPFMSAEPLDKEGFKYNHKLDEKPLLKDSLRLNVNCSSSSDPEVNTKSTQKMVNDLALPKRMLPLPSQGIKRSMAKPKVREFTRVVIQPSSKIPRLVPSQVHIASGSSKKSTTSTPIARPRTWRRTESNPSSSPVHLQESSVSTSSLQRESPKKVGRLHSVSYIRKGNSLVRKPSAAVTIHRAPPGLRTTVCHVHSVSGDPMKKCVGSETKVDCVDRLTHLKTDGMNLSIERPKTPPLAHATKLPISSTKISWDTPNPTSADPLSEAGSKSTKLTVGENAPTHFGVSENQAADLLASNSEGQNVLHDGKSKPCKRKRMTYVKHKSNQLVAAPRPEIHDPSVNVKENARALSPFASNDLYYKKNKNQLIRNIASSESQFSQLVPIPDDNSNSEGQKAPLKVSSVKFSRGLSKRRLNRVLEKSYKPSKFSLVWTPGGTESHDEDTTSLRHRKVLPKLFPWKRTTYLRHFMNNMASVSNKSSLSLISRKLQLSRKRDTVYTRSSGGYSLRKSKVLSIGGSSLKWSKSIEKRSKKANEDATLAVAAVEKKKREQKGAACVIASAKNGNISSRKSTHGIKLHPGERIFRIGSVRYKMDSSKRTLLKIPDDNSSCALQTGNKARISFVPRRLAIGNDEYIRVNNGNKLVRDPKKLIRLLASEKIRWSLHTARMRLAKKQQYCQFFTRFGKCNKDGGKCPYIHDPAKVAVCTKFLKGLCSSTNCKLTHKVIPERMPDCSYFLQGLCTNENCSYRHVNVNPSASVCEGFLRGYCADGDECRKKHRYVCTQFEATGVCDQGSKCKLHHPKNRNSRRKKKSKGQKNTIGRYFGSRLIDVGKSQMVPSVKNSAEDEEDIFFCEGRFADYISLDFDNEESRETVDPMDAYSPLHNDDFSDLQSDELDELIKPVLLMKKNPT